MFGIHSHAANTLCILHHIQVHLHMKSVNNDNSEDFRGSEQHVIRPEWISHHNSRLIHRVSKQLVYLIARCLSKQFREKKLSDSFLDWNKEWSKARKHLTYVDIFSLLTVCHPCVGCLGISLCKQHKLLHSKSSLLHLEYILMPHDLLLSDLGIGQVSPFKCIVCVYMCMCMYACMYYVCM